MSTLALSKPIVVTALVLGTLGTPGITQALPFQNGSFEDGPTAPVNFCGACGAPYIGTFFAPYGGIPGWTVTAGSIDIIFLTGTAGWSASNGLRSIDLDGLSGGTMAQTFDTVAGSTYTVSFDLAANFYAGDLIKSVLVSAPGFSQIYTFNSAGRTALNMQQFHARRLIEGLDGRRAIFWLSQHSLERFCAVLPTDQIDAHDVLLLSPLKPVSAHCNCRLTWPRMQATPLICFRPDAA